MNAQVLYSSNTNITLNWFSHTSPTETSCFHKFKGKKCLSRRDSHEINMSNMSVKSTFAIGSTTEALTSFSRQLFIPIIVCQLFTNSYLLKKFYKELKNEQDDDLCDTPRGRNLFNCGLNICAENQLKSKNY